MAVNISDCVDDLFKKNFCFEKSSDWDFPSDFLDEDFIWSVDSLNILKQDLNCTKSLLNDKGEDWHEHTAKINKASLIIDVIKRKLQPEILTQAWCKFFEIVSSYDLLPVNKQHIRTLHLCEAPGAFISALNYYLCVNHPDVDWEWMANTLNPYYEGHNIRKVIVDDRLLFPTLKHWYFGEDNTGDITDSSYIDDLCKLVNDVGLFDLITADGSIDCLDNPGEQELAVAKLHFVETLIALSTLLPQGSFVLKMFTFFECITICQLYLLNCVFEKVSVFKPFTSRSSNSEVYVICMGFHGSEDLKNLLQHYKHVYRTKKSMTIFPQSSIPKSFLQQVEACMKLFTNLQKSAIRENLELYPLQDDLVIQKLNDLKEAYAKAFVQRYSLCPNGVYNYWKLYSPKKKVFASFFDGTNKNCKSVYFQAVGDTFNNIVKSSSVSWYQKLLNIENRISVLFPLCRKRPCKEIEWQFPPKEVMKKMKSKNFHNWITLGKKVECIHNSKFCYPVLLYLWNQVSHESEIDDQSHIASHFCWDSEDLTNVLMDDMPSTKYSVIAILPRNKCSKNDPLLLHLEKKFKVTYFSELDVSSDVDFLVQNKIVYINTTVWINSLHQECMIKKNLTEIIVSVLKFLRTGDFLLLCIQSLLTRYIAGLIFIILSHFYKFTAILPEDPAPASSGQIWIFKDFQDRKWLNNTIQYLDTIKELDSSEKDIIEIVPMSSLCDGVFHLYLRNLNNKHLLQRLRNFIAVEKCAIEKSKKCK